MLTSCGFFAYCINKIGAIFEQLQEEENEINKNLYVINNYMHKKSISKELQYNIREYLDYYWNEKS